MRTRSHFSRLRLLPITACVLAACGPDVAPIAPTNDAVSLHVGASRTSALASPAWQVLAATLVSQTAFNPLVAGHAYPLLGVAQYRAVQRAQARHDDWDDDDGRESARDTRGRRSRVETDRGAVAGASAAVLTFLFPTRTADIGALFATQANGGSGPIHPAFTAGDAIGRAVAAEVIARAMMDGFSTPANPVPPVGAGYWISNTSPSTVAGGQLPGVKPWFLRAANQFRPAPPPAFGSAAYLTALAEIRHISDTRSPEQLTIAAYWALNPGTPAAAGFWLQAATDRITASRHISERRATHLYALMSASMFDALIGCFDAKLTYWTIRPWQADPGITILASVGKPNHPSYPSAHSCVSSSGAAVLSAFFPADRETLDAMVTEAGLSRMYGGIHYRFDIEAGQALGRNVAALALRADASGRSVLTSRW